jgi:hypothetical protein
MHLSLFRSRPEKDSGPGYPVPVGEEVYRFGIRQTVSGKMDETGKRIAKTGLLYIWKKIELGLVIRQRFRTLKPRMVHKSFAELV